MTRVTIHAGDNRDHLRRLIDRGVRVHSVVTDPPYGLTSVKKRFSKSGAAPAKSDGNDGSFARLSKGFMGKEWDGTGIERDPEFWSLILEILLPGGYVFAFSGSRTSHWQAVAMELAGFVIHPLNGWIYGCMDPDTQLLTRRGWIDYRDVRQDDEVLQWDHTTGDLAWVIPCAVHEYPFDGELVVLENRNTRQVLTPNHRVYAKVRRHARNAKPTSYEVLEAGQIESRSSAWHVDLPLAGNLRDGRPIDPDYAYLVGWWLTDAWAHRDANACCFSQSKPETLKKLRKALEPYGPSEYVKKAKNARHADEHSFYVTGTIADRLRSEFPDRTLPWSVLSWDAAARRRLFEGLMDGDGSQSDTIAGRPNYSHTFWSKDQTRRDVFMALAISLGMRCQEDPLKAAVYVNTHRNTTQLQNKHRSRKVRHNGKVWCLTVPTGAFVVRRDGKPFITGNSGFPKHHAADKAIDKLLGVEREVVGTVKRRDIRNGQGEEYGANAISAAMREGGPKYIDHAITKPGSPEAEQWEGWAYGGQSQKPALEPIIFAQKPFSEKSGAANILKHGVGAVNIDDCRVPSLGEQGRHPANLMHDGSDAVIDLFPDSKGQLAPASTNTDRRKTQNVYGAMHHGLNGQKPRNDSGSAARFFHCFPLTEEDIPTYVPPVFYNVKASKTDRAGSKHPTVKPIALLQNLVRFITPTGGVVLDPFAGSGTTAEAARREGFDCILMEAEDEYVDFLQQRFPSELTVEELLS